MKKLASALCLLGFVASLSACNVKANGGNDNVTGDGTCTKSYIDAYNTMTQKTAMYISYASRLSDKSTYGELAHFYGQADKTNSACNSFYASKADISCTAELHKKEVTVKSDDFKSLCESAKQVYLEEIKSN